MVLPNPDQLCKLYNIALAENTDDSTVKAANTHPTV
jgi:hypothetical protein